LTPLQVLEGAVIRQKLQGSGRYAAIVRDCPEIDTSIKQDPNVVVLKDEPAAYAHDFYRVLRDLRNAEIDQIRTTRCWVLLPAYWTIR
jgi:hypothetical protein